MMEEQIEEIITEPDGPVFTITGFVKSIFERSGEIIASNGWYILGGAVAGYYVWTKFGVPIFFSQNGAVKPPMTKKELLDFQTNEEQRLKHLEKLQEKYNKEANERAAQLQAREEEKRKERLAELEKMNPNISRAKIGNNTTEASSSNSKSESSISSNKNSKSNKPKSNSLRPEYNPLMSDTTSRVCFRPSSGRSGG